MRPAIACVGLLFAGAVIARAADDGKTKELIKAKVEEINGALVKGDFKKVAELTHPKIVELSGGKEKMIAAMESGMQKLKEKGFAVESSAAGTPSDCVESGADLFVVVPYTLKMKTPKGKLTQKSFLIGVSPDKGATWTFINGDLDVQRIKKVLPNLPDKLKLPEKEMPVIENDGK